MPHSETAFNLSFLVVDSANAQLEITALKITALKIGSGPKVCQVVARTAFALGCLGRRCRVVGCPQSWTPPSQKRTEKEKPHRALFSSFFRLVILPVPAHIRRRCPLAASCSLPIHRFRRILTKVDLSIRCRQSQVEEAQKGCACAISTFLGHLCLVTLHFLWPGAGIDCPLNAACSRLPLPNNASLFDSSTPLEQSVTATRHGVSC
ncbi:hypothetical protein QBC34DRAFT_97201 [Podospora aff. communis PSN243]|uniref:Uncharacterized protein n=1 Tax=Podospora aff. communis PSN243 TaxID=3040156 RepID=A0AAV9GMZ0_9PEZI|nr:hypothetical protein QBC34DRAFT_97201 [Podospora aff. communis PSN243]